MSESLEAESAQLSQQCKISKKYDDGSADAELHKDPKSYY